LEKSARGTAKRKSICQQPAKDLSANLMMVVPQFVFHSTAANNLAGILHAEKVGTLRIACFNV
jgi:hypothetical protein